MKIGRVAVLALVVLGFSLPLRAENAKPLGLCVKDGVLMKDGKPWRGIGLNYFDSFLRTIQNPENKSWRDGFRVLREKYDIPFIRFAACGFWPVEWKLYRTDPDRYFALMDEFVREAEQRKLGLIPSLFWHFPAVPDIVGEHMDALGDPESKTRAFMRKYIRDVVGRYRNSPAIWGWEIGNEYNLAMDLPNASEHRPWIVPHLGTPKTRTERDEVTSKVMISCLRFCASEIRAVDPHRMITSGNSIPRPCAWHNTAERSWTLDTEAQFTEVLGRDNPDPIDAISVHIYPLRKNQYFADRRVDVPRLVEACVKAAAHWKKPLFLGEFGASAKSETRHEDFMAILKAIETYKVPAAAVWNFDRSVEDKEWNIRADNDQAWMLEEIKRANERIRNQMTKATK